MDSLCMGFLKRKEINIDKLLWNYLIIRICVEIMFWFKGLRRWKRSFEVIIMVVICNKRSGIVYLRGLLFMKMFFEVNIWFVWYMRFFKRNGLWILFFCVEVILFMFSVDIIMVFFVYVKGNFIECE